MIPTVAITQEYLQSLSVSELYELSIDDVFKSFLLDHPDHEIKRMGSYWDDCCNNGLIRREMTVQEYIMHPHMRILHLLNNCSLYTAQERREAVIDYVAFMYYVSRLTEGHFSPFK